MAEQLPIDRYAHGVLPTEASITAAWLTEMQATVLGTHSDYTPSEVERLRPGVDMLVDVVEEERLEALRDAAATKELLTLSGRRFAAKAKERRRTVTEVQEEQARTRAHAHATIRGHLRDLIRDASTLGIPVHEMPGLLDQVIAAQGPDRNEGGATVLSITRRQHRAT